MVGTLRHKITFVLGTLRHKTLGNRSAPCRVIKLTCVRANSSCRRGNLALTIARAKAILERLSGSPALKH